MHRVAPASSARYGVVAVTAFAAFWMYIDRVSFSTLAKPIADDLNVEPGRMAYVLGAFFFSYALFQIPTGALADRFGPRVVLAGCVVAWSAATALTSFAGGFAGLLAARLLLGVSEAGAYPAASGLVRNWAGPGERGLFSSLVTLGGRLGLAAAPPLSAILALTFATVIGSEAGTNWRAVFVFYGVCGFGVAALLWTVVRDRAASAPPPADPAGAREKALAIVGSRNMWLSGAYQCGTNVGWVFLVTLLPVYLADAHGVALKQIGWMQFVPLAVGCAGMFAGGFLTDFLAARLGVRWGRALPLCIAMFGSVVPVAVCPHLPGPWEVVASLAVVAFLVDLANPSVWAFNQDVGGRHLGAAFGWGNMWGNLGAAASPVLLTAVQAEFGWPAAFLTCGGFFLSAGACGFLMDATRPLEDPRPGGES